MERKGREGRRIGIDTVDIETIVSSLVDEIVQSYFSLLLLSMVTRSGFFCSLARCLAKLLSCSLEKGRFLAEHMILTQPLDF